jgi:hypothetical protein
MGLRIGQFACLAVIACLASLDSPAQANELAEGRSKLKVQAVIPLPARAFALEDVRLLDGPFRRHNSTGSTSCPRDRR